MASAGAGTSTEFAGRRWPIFKLALKTSILTVLTLGFYRFWMKTRLRRWYWSAIRPGGLPLEYAGLPAEKLLGFLIAVVVLAFYIGVVNLILMFASFAILHGNVAAYLVSFVGIVPLIFYARYRARRYVLARTRWRGIRFGLEPGAWGYALRAMWHWILTLLTLGLLWPRKTFWLEKYLTDRTYFGTQPMLQGGRWTMLIAPFLPVAATVLFSVLALLAALGGATEGIVALVLALPLLLLALVNYRVAGFRRLTAAKRAGPVRFAAAPRARRVAAIYVFGGLAVALVVLIFATGFAVAAAFAIVGLDAGPSVEAALDALGGLPRWIAAALAVGLYFSGFVLMGVLSHVFVTMPLIRHFAQTLRISGIESLAEVRQRGRDAFVEAEGFAEALDVGAAI